MKTATHPGVLGLTDRVFADLPTSARTGRADDAVRNVITEILGQQHPDHPFRRHAALVQKTRQSLTPVLWSLLHDIAAGLPNGEIAERRGVTADTVKTHTARLYKRLGARNRAHAVATAFRMGLLGQDERGA